MKLPVPRQGAFSRKQEDRSMTQKSFSPDRIAPITPYHPLPDEKFTVTEPVAPQFKRSDFDNLEKLGCTERIHRLRKQYFLNKTTICTHRARIYTDVYQATEGEPVSIRRGKAFLKYCEEKPIVIQQDELIIGNPGCRPKYAMVAPDYSWEWVLEELDTLSSRPQDPYLISEEQKKELAEEIIPYWRGKSVFEHVIGNLPEETRRLTYGTEFAGEVQKSLRGVGHNAPGLKRLLTIGFRGVEEQAEKTLKTLSYLNARDHEKIAFLNSILLCCRGMKILGERHAAEARRLAESETDAQRKKELLKIADVCGRVPYNPAETFHEAAQACWFIQMGTKMVQCGASFGLGRFDQYMYPYYKKDLTEGRITEEQVQELIECLWIKNAEVIPIGADKTAKYVAGYMVTQMVSVGGLTREGLDATNELSFKCLEATSNVRLVSPSLSLRVHKNSPEKLLMKAAEVVRNGGGMPQFHNDDVGIRMMLSAGTTIEDAYDYEIRGCSESMVAGKMWKYSDAGPLNLGSCLEWALFDGNSQLVKSEKRWGLATGDSRRFQSYEELWAAFTEQIANLTKHVFISTMIIEKVHSELCPEPYISSILEGPVDTGIDYLKGGALYNVGPAPQYTGIADTANSLAAIRKYVFDEKLITMDALLSALENDFQGHEDLRLMLLNRSPKYGWDDEYADSIARDIADFCAEEVVKYKTFRGCTGTSGLYPVSGNTPLGMAVCALPSGRKAGMPLAEGISPQQGTDRTPTEVIKSVTSFDHSRHQDGGMLNIKFNPSVLAGERGLKNLVSLVRSYMDRGGWHIQFNVVSNETLKDAQDNPEKYPNLLVRVAGYSAYFADLSREVQNDIMNRKEHFTA